jgi:hypothetical protein
MKPDRGKLINNSKADTNETNRNTQFSAFIQMIGYGLKDHSKQKPANRHQCGTTHLHEPVSLSSLDTGTTLSLIHLYIPASDFKMFRFYSTVLD